MASFLPLGRPVPVPLHAPELAAVNPYSHAARSLVIGFALATALSACDAENGESGRETTAGVAAMPEPAFPAVGDSILARGAGTDWPVHGGDLANQSFSPLDQISTSNARELVPVWVHSTGLEGAFEATPLVVGNTLYATTARGRVVALNAATGESLWSYDPAPGTVTLCCGPTNRGVAAYGDRLYVGTLDARLVALNARSGQPVWEKSLADPEAGYSVTMAPLAVDGRVYIGVAGERYGIRGFLAAFDAASGEELWRWHTIPSDEEGGWWGDWAASDPFGTPLNRDIPAERADSLGTRGSWNVGGGGIRTTPAYDLESGRLFVNVEGPAPLVDGGVRPGNNRHTGSIVALDAATGELAWASQYLPHDVWGLSGGSAPFLFDRGDGRYVAFAGRTGWIYVFDATNGRPVLRSDNFVPQEAMFSRPPAEGAVRVAPGAHGGNAGGNVAYSPSTGVAFVGGVHQPMVYTRDPEGYRRGQLWLGGTVRFPPGEEQWGTVTAIDLGDGSIVWQRRTPRPVHSGALTTAGGLVFVGQGSGTLDAFDARTGELLWQFNTGAGIHGSPVTYAVGGVQFVAVPAGGSAQFDTPEGDDLLAFALADRRPARGVSDYPEPRYTAGGPVVAGQGAVRQLRSDSGPSDTTRRDTIRSETVRRDTAGADTAGRSPRPR